MTTSARLPTGICGWTRRILLCHLARSAKVSSSPSKTIWSAHCAAIRFCAGVRTVQTMTGVALIVRSRNGIALGQIVHAIGQEIRPGFRIMEKIGEVGFLLRRQSAPIFAVVTGFGDDPQRAGAAWRSGRTGALAKIGDDRGIEAFQRERAAVIRGDLSDAPRQSHVAVEGAFDFANQRRAAGDPLQQFRQCRDSFGALP